MTILISLVLTLALFLALFLACQFRLWPGLSGFSRTNANGHWNLAAYHDPRSLTWSWFLMFRLLREGEGRVWPLLSAHRLGQERVVLRIPFIGFLSLFTQRRTWRHPRPARGDGSGLLALGVIGLALTLAACSSDPLAHKFVSMKVQAAGFNFSPTTGFTGGYAATTGHFTPATTPDGKTLLTVQQPCGQSDTIATISNLNSKATASANSTGIPTAPGVNAPAVSWASGDQAATGAAARILALGGGVSPSSQALAAYQNSCPNGNLPFAPAGSIVTQGVAPQ